MLLDGPGDRAQRKTPLLSRAEGARIWSEKESLSADRQAETKL